MAAFEAQRLFDRPAAARGRSVSLAVTASLFLFPILIVAVALARTAAERPAVSLNFWLGISLPIAGAALLFIAVRLGGLVAKLRLRDDQRTGPRVEVLGTREKLVDRLEELARGSLNLFFLDSSNVTSHLVGAPGFLTSRCAPRASYRQISSVRSEQEFRDLVCLIRKSREAEKGSYLCADEYPLFIASLSFCVIERDDGHYVFVIHGTRDKKPAHVVLVRDEIFGRLMRREFERLWTSLAEKRSPLFRDGRLDGAEEARLSEKFRRPGHIR